MVSTYERYLAVRQQLGFHYDLRIRQHVWENCPPDSQEDMIAQLEGALTLPYMKEDAAERIAEHIAECEREIRYGVSW